MAVFIDLVLAGRRGLSSRRGPFLPRSVEVSISERGKEIKRRRHRRKKLAHWVKRLEKATVSERAAIAEKIRQMTPGCDIIVERLDLQQR